MTAMGPQPGRSAGRAGTRLAVAFASVVLALLLTLSVTVADEGVPPGSLESVRVNLPLALSGGAAASTVDGKLHMAPLSTPAGEFLLHVQAAEVTVRVVNITTTAYLPDDRLGLLSRLPLGEQEQTNSPTYGPYRDAWLDLDTTNPGSYLLAETWEAGDARLRSETLTGEAGLADVQEDLLLTYADDPSTNDHLRKVPAGHFLFQADAPLSTMEGDFHLYLHGFDFVVEHEDGQLPVQTGTHTSASGPTDGPSVGGDAGIQKHTQYARLELKGAYLSLHTDAPHDLFAPSGAMQVQVDGDVASSGLAGGIRIGSDVVHAAGESGQMSGQFTFVPKGKGDGQATLFYDGTVQAVTVGPQAYDAGKSSAVRTTAGVMVALAGLGALAWQLAKSGVAMGLYAKLTRRKVLDQGTRHLIYLKVQHDAGVTTKTVAQDLDVSWSTAAYHLRVLRHMGLITARRRGRHEHHFIAGERSLGDQEIVAALRHPTTRQIAGLVTREPGIIQKEICRRLGIAPSTASDHLRRLKDLGAVREVQEWRTRSYHPVESLARATGADPQAEPIGAPAAVAHLPVAAAEPSA